MQKCSDGHSRPGHLASIGPLMHHCPGLPPQVHHLLPWLPGSGRESVRPWLVLFGTHVERGCQPLGWLSAEMWMLPLGSISHFPGWHVSLTSTGGGCWKTHKTHLHRMRGRVTTLETWRVWFSWRARHAVPSQQRLILEKKIRYKMHEKNHLFQVITWWIVAKWSVLFYSRLSQLGFHDVDLGKVWSELHPF